MGLKTKKKRQREKRWQNIKTLYCKLVAEGGQKTACEQAVMKKYGIRSRATVWRIVTMK